MPGFIISDQNSGDTGPSSIIETARAYRWVINYVPTAISDATQSQGGGNAVDESWWPQHIAAYASSVTRPSLEFDRIIIHKQSTEIYLPGKQRAGTCTLKLYEPVKSGDSGGSDMSADLFRQWWSKVVADDTNHIFNSGFKRQLRIKLLDGCDNPIWTYLLIGAFPIKIEPTELEYSNSELSNLSVILSIDAFKEGQAI